MISPNHMKIKKGDNVMVITGKDKGKKGAVVRALPKEDKVIVAGVNIAKKHTRPRKAGEKGQTVEKTMPVHVSNVKKI
jgi:large subunit ribosomal protein L24